MLLWLLPWIWGRKKGPSPDNKEVISLQDNNVSSLLKKGPMKIHGLKDNNVSSLLKECSNENSWANTFEFLHCNLGKMLQVCVIFLWQQFFFNAILAKCHKFVSSLQDKNVSSLLKECSNENSWAKRQQCLKFVERMFQ